MFTTSAHPWPATTSLTADIATTHTLLNCLAREVCGPQHQLVVDGQHLFLGLPWTGTRLRIRIRRSSLLGAHRFDGPVFAESDGEWTEVDAGTLADLVDAEMTARSGHSNDEFTAQVRDSCHGVDLGMRRSREATRSTYLRSEQSLVLGHRFHPTPKARTGDDERWLRYAPEAGAAFPLRHLAVRDHLLVQDEAQHGAASPFDRHAPDLPEGYRFLPAHPWQWEMLAGHAALQAALANGDVIDLGPGSRQYHATASVRTVYDGEDFLKFSLDVRITNCVRKNAAYELTGAVALTRLLDPLLTDLERAHPNSAMLREPAYRSLGLPTGDGTLDRRLLEGLGVILRRGLDHHTGSDETPLLAGAVADEYPHSPGHVSVLLRSASTEQVLDWWSRYVDLLVPFTLAAYLDHGIVLEPHLQNCVVCVDAGGLPVRMLFRDLEGTKLVAHRHADLLAGLPPEVAGPMTYDAIRGWNRVTYCLFVNHVAEVVAALSDLHPRIEATLWRRVRTAIVRCATERDTPRPLAALLAGVPLPAKANLLARWERVADREAGYVLLPSPLGPDDLDADLRGLRGC